MEVYSIVFPNKDIDFIIIILSKIYKVHKKDKQNILLTGSIRTREKI